MKKQQSNHVQNRPATSWRLSHHRHSGKLLAHRNTSYPTLVMLLLCVGVLLSGVTRATFALTVTDSGSYSVTASYPGPPPASAATISSPTEGNRFTAVPITVNGSCPLNTYVTLLRNSFSSGVALCDATGQYSLKTDLFKGSNALQAQVYSQTDVPGPISSTVNVIYDPSVITGPSAPQPAGGSTPVSNGPNATPPSGSTSGSAPVMTDPLTLKTQFKYLAHTPGQSVIYQFAVEGGTSPYAVVVDWGDGTQKIVTVSESGAFSLSHSYERKGGYKGSYRITVTAADAAGNQTILQLMALVNDLPGSALNSTKPTPPTLTSVDSLAQRIQSLLKYIWPTFGFTVLMLASFWLGEMRELKLLRPKHGRIHHV